MHAAQTNFRKIIELAIYSGIAAELPYDDPKILQRIEQMKNEINDPKKYCYLVPRMFKDCSEGNYEGVKEHIKSGYDLNEIGIDGETPLTCAINANNFKIVELLLRSGVDANVPPDKVESTPLMDAANIGYKEIVKLLLKYGANPDIKSSTNNTALHYAAFSGHSECCQLLLEYSTNKYILMEEQNENGHTALMEASTNGFLDTVKFLVNSGAQINTSSAEFKETALTLASYKGYSDVVQFLLEVGADYEHRTDEMHTALMEASMEGHIEAAKVLLNYGAQVNMRADSFESPLTLAACNGHTDLAGFLLSYGSDIEEVNDESYTPLMEASREGHLETVVMLLALGAKINRITEETQETSMSLAACGGFYDIVLLLHRCGADLEKGASTPLMESAQEGHLKIVKSLIRMGADIEARNSSYETSLHFAAENGHIEVCLYLLDCNANIHQTSEGGQNALMKACRTGNLNVVMLLVERGACIDQLTVQGDHNALSLACVNGHCKVVEYLLKAGADPTIKLKDNSTALIEASRAGHSDVIETLLKEYKLYKKLAGMTNHYLCTSNEVQDVNNHHHLVMDDFTLGTSQENCAIVNSFPNHPIEEQISNHQSIYNTVSNYWSQECFTFKDSSVSLPHIQMIQNISPCHSCSFSHLENQEDIQSKSFMNMQMTIGVLSNEMMTDTDLTYLTSLPPCNEIPHNPLFSPIITESCFDNGIFGNTVNGNCKHDNEFGEPNYTALSLNDEVIFSASENKKILLNLPDHNSSNFEEWIKYVYPNFNNNLCLSNYSTNSDSSSSLSSSSSKISFSQTEISNNHLPFSQSLQKSTNINNNYYNSECNRKIKKAKHSDNCRTFPYSFDQQRINSQFSPANSIALQSNDIDKYPTDLNSDREVTSTIKSFCKEIDFSYQIDNNKMTTDFSISSSDDCSIFLSSNSFHSNSKILFSQSPANIFSTSINKPFGSSVNQSSTIPGIFSVDKLIDSDMQSATDDIFSRQDHQITVTSSKFTPSSPENNALDAKMLFHSDTVNTNSQIKSKYLNQDLTSSSPLQKQVLQPKRRLQPNQRSTLINMPQISSAAFGCSDNRQTSFIRPIPQSHSSLSCLPSASQTIFDSIPFNSQESSIFNKNSSASSSFSEKMYSCNDNVKEYHQTKSNDLYFTSNNTVSSHRCQMLQNYNNREHRPISSNCPIDFVPKVIMNNGEINNSKPPIQAMSNSNSIENLEVVEEIDFEENDEEDDIDSENETDHCNALSHNYNDDNNNTVSINHGSCLRHNCKRKLNVNICTESLQESPLSLACSGGHIEVVKLLVNSGAKLEHRDKKSQTALHVAVYHGHVEIVKFLLDSGANIESLVERTKDTSLSIACANGKYEIVQELVNRGAAIEHRNISDYTPLSLAASGGYLDIMKFLLKNNAEINSRTNTKLGISPLMLAAMNGHLEAVNILLENGSDINAQIETNRNTALTLACFQGRSEVVSLLLEKKSYIEHRAKSGLTPLMEAASQGHIAVGRILISEGAEVNAAPVPSSRETVLIIAADKGHTEFVKLLLENGAFVEARNKKGSTPLWLACNGGFIEVVKLLIDFKADTNTSDNRRITCLMISFKKGHIKVVKELVKYVTQFPSEHDCNKHLKSIKDAEKDLINKCEVSKEIILRAKERQEYEATKNAKDLLKQVEEERKAKEQKEVKQARKREKKRAKKKAKQEKDDFPKNVFKETSDDLIMTENHQDYLGNYYIEDSDSKSSTINNNINNNNENINPENYILDNAKKPLKVGKSESEQIKTFNVLDTNSEIIVFNGDISLKKKESTLSTNEHSLNSKSRLNCSNVIKTSTNLGSGTIKRNTVIQLNSNKNVSHNKADENITSNWQKIGGGKKKLDIQVNKKDIGKVIGQGGSVVNAIRHITGAHIDIDSVANEYDERTVHLKGISDAVLKAKDLICDLVESKITGNHVIQESEYFVTESINDTKSSSNEYTINNINDSDNGKSNVQCKSLSSIRHNGKLNKVGFSRKSNFSSTTSNGKGLQYGFSKSVKAPDFATVAATGIVIPKTSNQQTQKAKYSTRTVNNIDNFHSLEEPLSESLFTNHSFENSKVFETLSTNNKKMVLNLSSKSPNENEISLISESLEVNKNIPTVISDDSLCSLSSVKPTLPVNNVLKSFPLAPGSERSLHQRTYNSTPEHFQLENSSNNKPKYKLGEIIVETNSSDHHSQSILNNYENDNHGADFSSGNNIDKINTCQENSMNISHINWATPLKGKSESHFNNQYLLDSQSNMNSSVTNEQSLLLNDCEVLSHYPKLRSLNPKAEVFSPSVENVTNNKYFNMNPDDLYYVNGALSLNPTANIFKPRCTVQMHHRVGNVGSNIQSMPFGCSGPNLVLAQKNQSKFDHSIVNTSSTVNKYGKNTPIYSIHHNHPSNSSNTTLSSSLQNYTTGSQSNFIVPHEERLIRLQDHINKAINILISTTNYDQSMAEAAFSSFMRSANLDLNSYLTSSEFTILINNIINQSSNFTPSAPIINPTNNISQPIPFLSTNNRVNYTAPPSNHLPDLNSENNLNRILPPQNSIPIILNPISPPGQSGLGSQAAHTQWPLLNNVSLSSFSSIWAAPSSNNTLQPLNSPYFSNLGHCASAQTAFNSALSFNIQQPSQIPISSNSNGLSVSFHGIDNSISHNNNATASLTQQMINSNLKIAISSSKSSNVSERNCSPSSIPDLNNKKS